MGADRIEVENSTAPVSWLKELSGIGIGAAAILYVCGYLVHTIYYRLIGVDVGAQPLNYLSFSGDFIISIVISIPQLFTLFNEYYSKLGDNWLWLSIVFCIATIICIFISQRKLENRWLKLVICILVVLAAVIINLAQMKVLRVQNVLQPIAPIEVQGEGEITRNEKILPLESRLRFVRDSYDHHLIQGANISPGFNEWKRWFGPLTPNNESERNNAYLALLLSNLIFLATLIFAVFKRGTSPYSKIIVLEALVTGLFTLLLLPCVYATLGKVFLFPVVTLELKVEKDDPSDTGNLKPTIEKEATDNKEKTDAKFETHPVFLLFQDETEIIVYDRINLFQIKRIPKSDVLILRILYRSSPSRDCQLGKGDFVPCETIWLKEKTPILDF